jgi:hypothetical protein
MSSILSRIFNEKIPLIVMYQNSRTFAWDVHEPIGEVSDERDDKSQSKPAENTTVRSTARAMTGWQG